ncbi:MAG TPA: LuxR C-terminal-related transcriptional regulator, partial [Thermoanaerobaculia bacterium]|nr:LuxR C-terminal-related transcriptional regulator [Thermoanaerobaculia bacterium]
RIILWNKACEKLVGKPAKAVLGKPCYDVMCGRDANGNLYCHRSCAVAYQARERKEDPVRRFELKVATGNGKARLVSSSLFAVPSYHPALTTVVHVLRPVADAAASASAAEAPAEPLTPMTNGEGETVALTPREKEILRSLAQGMPTQAISKKFFIASVTVRNHIQNILQKLGVHSKLEAVVLAHKHQLI